MIHKAGTSHIASNFSVIDIATVLYENLKEGDEVVWSKGWVAASIYYFLAKQGNIPQEDLEKFPHAPYFGLAEVGVNGVHVSGGSMGHGLPVAVGMALAKKLANEPGNIYCIMSDGELNEGTTWESAMLASHHNLSNLIVFVDKNNWQAMGRTSDIIHLKRLAQIWHGFDWEFYELDGHDTGQIEKSLLHIQAGVLSKKPVMIMCNTVKGKGVSFFEDHLLYHYKHVDDVDYQKALLELQS